MVLRAKDYETDETRHLARAPGLLFQQQQQDGEEPEGSEDQQADDAAALLGKRKWEEGEVEERDGEEGAHVLAAAGEERDGADADAITPSGIAAGGGGGVQGLEATRRPSKRSCGSERGLEGGFGRGGRVDYEGVKLGGLLKVGRQSFGGSGDTSCGEVGGDVGEVGDQEKGKRQLQQQEEEEGSKQGKKQRAGQKGGGVEVAEKQERKGSGRRAVPGVGGGKEVVRGGGRKGTGGTSKTGAAADDDVIIDDDGFEDATKVWEPTADEVARNKAGGPFYIKKILGFKVS